MSPEGTNACPPSMAEDAKRRADTGQAAMKARAECFLAGLIDSGAAPIATWDFADIDHLDLGELAAASSGQSGARRASEFLSGLDTLCGDRRSSNEPSGG